MKQLLQSSMSPKQTSTLDDSVKTFSIPPIVSKLGLVALTAFSGFTGYIFNIVVAKLWGSLVLGQLLSLIGFFGFIALPAVLFTLPTAKSSVLYSDWYRRVCNLQWKIMVSASVISLGIFFSVKFFNVFSSTPFGFVLPLLLWLPAPFLQTVQIGALMGRRLYWMMAITTAIPTIGKLLVLGISYLVFSDLDAVSVLWSMTISAWVAIALGLFVLSRASNSTETASVPSSLWASGWATLTTSAWTTWDIALAGSVLSTSALATYAIVSTIGKIPFQLAGILANVGIGDSNWIKKEQEGETSVTRLKRVLLSTPALITFVGLSTTVALSLASPYILRSFDLVEGTSSIFMYALASTLLALVYYFIGVDTQVGMHTWVPSAILLVVWTSLVFSFPQSLFSFIAALFGALLTTLILTTILRGYLKTYRK